MGYDYKFSFFIFTKNGHEKCGLCTINIFQMTVKNYWLFIIYLSAAKAVCAWLWVSECRRVSNCCWCCGWLKLGYARLWPLLYGSPSRCPSLPTIFGILSLSVPRPIRQVPPMLALPIPPPMISCCWWLWWSWWWWLCWWWWWWWCEWCWWCDWWLCWWLMAGVLLHSARSFLLLWPPPFNSRAPFSELVLRRQTCVWSQLLQRCLAAAVAALPWLSAFRLAATSWACNVLDGETGVLSSSPVGGGVERRLETVEEPLEDRQTLLLLLRA